MYPYHISEHTGLDVPKVVGIVKRNLYRSHQDEPNTGVVHIPHVVKLFFKNIFNSYIAKPDELASVGVPKVVTLFKKNIQVKHSSTPEDTTMGVPRVVSFFQKSYVKFLGTFSGDETSLISVPIPDKIFSTCKPKIGRVKNVQLTTENEGVALEWDTDSVTYSGFKIYFSDFPVGVNLEENFVGQVPYGTTEFFHEFEPVAGRTYYYVIRTYGGNVIQDSPVYQIRFSITPTDNVLLRFTKKVVQSLPLKIKFRRR